MCPLKTDKVAALVANKLTFGYVTSVAATEKSKAESKAKKAPKKEQENADDKPEPYDQQASNEAWRKGKGSKGKGGGKKEKGKKIRKERVDPVEEFETCSPRQRVSLGEIGQPRWRQDTPS